MTEGTGDRADRVGLVVGGVLRQAVCDARAGGIIVLDAASPEGELLRGWAEAALGAAHVRVVDPAALEDCRAALAERDPGVLDAAELERALARTLAARTGTLLAHPANKTALLLASRPPPEPLLPLGDLYASQVRELAGAWSGPAAVHRLAERAGGVAVLDAVLAALFEGRTPPAAAVVRLDATAAGELLDALEAGRFWRRRAGLVPKLGSRTLGLDILG